MRIWPKPRKPWPPANSGKLLQRPAALDIRPEFRRNLLTDVSARAAELGAQTLLGCGPDHVAFFVDQPHRGDGFMTALRRVVRFALTGAQAAIRPRRIPSIAAR